MALPTTKTTITCPNCKTQFGADIYSIIDVGMDPQLKTQLLRGQLNTVKCPKCGTGGSLVVPLLYHDPAKELLLIYMPASADITENERQKMIGEMTNALIDALPAEQRRGYLFSPRQFLSMPSLFDAILEADGITREVLEEQRRKVGLIDRFLEAQAEGDDRLKELVEAQDATLDYEFFSLLTLSAESAQGEGDAATAQRLYDLRDAVLPQTSFGRQAAEQQQAVASINEQTTSSELLQKMIEATPAQVEALVAVARPLIDYNFYQMLTSRIDAAARRPGGKAESDRLSDLREQILDLTARKDKAARAAVDRAAKTLNEIVQSEDLLGAVRAHRDALDNTFLYLLSMNMKHAEEQKNTQVLQALEAVYEATMAVIEEEAPPEIQLINHLLRQPYPEGTRAALQANQADISDEVLDLMQAMSKDLRQQGRTELAERLGAIRAQALLMV